MEMSAHEIRKAYREARYPAKQIRILAELNDTTTTEIKSILESTGEDIAPSRINRQKSYTDEEIQTVVQMYHDGAQIKDIGEAIGRSFISVRKFIHTHRSLVPYRDKRGRKKEE